jgi:shikimate kinase
MEKLHERVHSIAHGGVSVLNAIPLNVGSTVAVDIGVEVCSSVNEHPKPSFGLVKAILDHFENLTGNRFDARITSTIPPAMGLKSSSAVSVALIQAISSISGINVFPPRLSAVISRRIGISITGAFDDAVSAYYGGCFITNNASMTIEKRICFDPDSVFVILANGKRQTINPLSLKSRKEEFRDVLNMAKRNDIIGAMNLNGRLVAQCMNYDLKPVLLAEKLGAMASGISGNGPSVFALFRKGEEGPLVEKFSELGRTIVTRPVEFECED